MVCFKQKLLDIEMTLSAERGSLSLFALIERIGADGFHDLVVSAPWLDSQSDDDLESIVSIVTETLTTEELRDISAVVILDPTHPVVVGLNNISREHCSDCRVESNDFNGLRIKGGLVVTSMRRQND